MTHPIAVQLYSVRDALQTNFEGTLHRLATMGYAGVEFAGIYGESPETAATRCADLGLQIISAHLPLPSSDAGQAGYEVAAALGVKTVVCPWMSPERFTSQEGIQRVCDELNAANEIAHAHDLRFAYHNHDFEFTPQPGIGVPYDVMRTLLTPTVQFEIDTYWVQVAGADPALVLYDLAERASLIHLKDGPGVTNKPMMPLGSGVMRLPEVIAASKNADWLIVELDVTEGDIFVALDESLRYLITEGLGHGR